VKQQFFRAVSGLWDRALAAPLNEIRREVGLGGVSDIFYGWGLSRYRIVGFFPDWFAPRPSDWPAHFAYGGFVVHQGAEFGTGQESVWGDGRRPLIVFCAGSAGQPAQRFFDAAVEASRARPWRALLLAPGYTPTANRLPENVVCPGFVPLYAVIGETAAIVHHGGMGTLSLALAHGRPQIVVPFGHDQFDNAARLEQLGVARILRAKKRLASRIAGAVESMLEDGNVLERAAEIAARVDLRDQMATVCAAIEGVPASRSAMSGAR
jgi:rhamnosyltransferase subunit B